MAVLLTAGNAIAATGDPYHAESLITESRVQILEGELSASELEVLRLKDLHQGQRLDVCACATSSYLDPMVFLERADSDAISLDRARFRELVAPLVQAQGPVEATRRLFEHHALAGNDDFEDRYAAASSWTVAEDGDYLFAMGSSLARPSAGGCRPIVGIDGPEVIAGEPAERGPDFVFPEQRLGTPTPSVISLTGTLQPRQPVRYYQLADMEAGQTLYAFAEAMTSGLRPVLILYDRSDKPLAQANFAATDATTAMEYRLPEDAVGYRFAVTATDPSGKATAGDFRLPPSCSSCRCISVGGT